MASFESIATDLQNESCSLQCRSGAGPQCVESAQCSGIRTNVFCECTPARASAYMSWAVKEDLCCLTKMALARDLAVVKRASSDICLEVSSPKRGARSTPPVIELSWTALHHASFGVDGKAKSSAACTVA